MSKVKQQPNEKNALRFVNSICISMFVSMLFLTFTPEVALAQIPNFSATEIEFRKGNYRVCLQECIKALAGGEDGEKWYILKLRCELATGEYKTAVKTYAESVEGYPNENNIELRWLGRKAFQRVNDPANAKRMFDDIERLVREAAWRYSNSENSVIVGEMLLEEGADPRKILELFFDKAKRYSPRNIAAYRASADLAIAKNDFALASKEIEQALKWDADNPDLLYRLALANFQLDGKKATEALTKAIKLNPNHAPSILLSVDNLIDRENYDQAEKQIKNVLEMNPKHELAHAYSAIIANLRGKFDEEKKHYAAAKKHFKLNPEVDYLIGKKLSQKYRFQEGSEYQRLALTSDPNHLPAQFQLSVDLLRLGKEKEGWELVEKYGENDGYNVVNHNMLKLYDKIKRFTTLTRGQINVRMDSREAELYGDEVIELLERASDQICSKYEVEITAPIMVEIFPTQSDFAIRTFGLPGGEGFLGVCFGRVITANSPASQKGNPTNWKSVLWHEFCHVVTLEKTKNRMPRWLSEGISVYEERNADSRWGEHLTPTYRKMILAGELAPVSQLSGSFLQPKSALHLQFAYFQASMVVEYLVEKYKLEIINRVLTDLSVGMPINESLQRYTGSIVALDKEFEEYALAKAKTNSTPVQWDEPDFGESPTPAKIKEFHLANPNNFWGIQLYASNLLNQKDYALAKKLLNKSIELYPAQESSGNAYQTLAQIYRIEENPDEEYKILMEWIKYDDQCVDAYERLMTLDSKAENWEQLRNTSELLFAVDPLRNSVHQMLASASIALNDQDLRLKSLKRTLLFGAADVAGANFEIAQIYEKRQQWKSAKRHVLQALEEAPRYRAAHQLLLKINEQEQSTDDSPEKDEKGQ